MSLIQEALKRQLDEQAGQAYTPPPIPPPPPPRGGKMVARIFGFLFAFLFLLAVAGSLFYLSTRNWSWKEALKAAEADLSKAEQKLSSLSSGSRSDNAPAAEPPSSSSPYAGVQVKVSKMKDAVEEYKKQIPDAATPPAPAATTASAATPPPASSVSDAPIFNAKESSSSWPRVTVNGILASGKTQGAAMVNNRMVSAGEQIQGVRIVEVQSRGVVMDFKGETRLVLIGQTTE